MSIVLMANVVTRLVTSALNYGWGFMVGVTVAGFFLGHTLTSMHRPLLISCLVVLAGLGLYGLLEYVFHRWIYHGRRSPAASRRKRLRRRAKKYRGSLCPSSA